MEDWLHFPEPIPAIRHHATAENAVAVRMDARFRGLQANSSI
jgi:hypothetical protein